MHTALVKINRDILTVLAVDSMENILVEHILTVEVWQEDDGFYTGVFKEMDLVTNSKNMDSLEAGYAAGMFSLVNCVYSSSNSSIAAACYIEFFNFTFNVKSR